MEILVFVFVFISLMIASHLIYPYGESFLKAWQKKRVEKFSPTVDRMFIRTNIKKILLIDIIGPLAAALVCFLITKIFWAAVLAAFAGLTFTNIIIKQLDLARKKKFIEQLVDGLMLLSGSLKAGLSLIQSFEALIEEMPPPISQEFGLVVRENRMGVPLEECLYKFRHRIECDELDMIVTAILVSRETGGDLTIIFSNLVMTIREHNRIISRAKALCTQGVLQGRIMIFLPVLFAYAVYQLDPSFLKVLMNDSLGRTLLIYAVISEVIGAILIMRLSKLDI